MGMRLSQKIRWGTDFGAPYSLAPSTPLMILSGVASVLNSGGCDEDVFAPFSTSASMHNNDKRWFSLFWGLTSWLTLS